MEINEIEQMKWYYCICYLNCHLLQVKKATFSFHKLVYSSFSLAKCCSSFSQYRETTHKKRRQFEFSLYYTLLNLVLWSSPTSLHSPLLFHGFNPEIVSSINKCLCFVAAVSWLRLERKEEGRRTSRTRFK